MISVTAVADTYYCERLAYIKNVLKMPPKSNRLYYWGTLKHGVVESIAQSVPMLDASADRSLSPEEIARHYEDAWLKLCMDKVSPRREEMALEGLDYSFVVKDLQEEIRKRAMLHAEAVVSEGYSTIESLTEKFISSNELGIRGRVDRIDLVNGMYIPHEYKSSRNVSERRKQRDAIQLACYGMLIQKSLGKRSPYGVLDYAHESSEIPFSHSIFQTALKCKAAYCQMARGLRAPAEQGECEACLYSDFCGK